ncbi:MAG: ABC transporter permease subunit [Chloroflexi bacterium]|nr:ABC transporter permease subunit [Chloroflexota bacterium]
MRSRYDPRIPQIGAILFILLIWYGTTGLGWVHPLLLPKTTLVIRKLVELLQVPETYFHIGVTLFEMTVAYSISVFLGVGVGFIVGTYRYLTDVFEPILLAMYAVPLIIFYPLAILFFGFESGSKIAYSAVSGFLIIAIYTIMGIKSVSKQLIAVSMSMGASQRDMLFKVLLPAAWPIALMGFRLAVIICFISVVAGEMMAATAGLGFKIGQSSEGFRTADLYAYVLIIVIIAFIINWALRRSTTAEVV